MVADQDVSRQLSGVHQVNGSYESLLTESFFLGICDKEPWIAAHASAANQGFQEENRDVS